MTRGKMAQVNGQNWGKLAVEEDGVTLNGLMDKGAGAALLTLPKDAIKVAEHHGKVDVAIELEKSAKEEGLTEVRFFIPALKQDEPDEGALSNVSVARSIQEKIPKGQVTGELTLDVSDINVVNPRFKGRLQLYSAEEGQGEGTVVLTNTGLNQGYPLPITSINTVYFLPNVRNDSMYLALNLIATAAIRHGPNRFALVVAEFKNSETYRPEGEEEDQEMSRYIARALKTALERPTHKVKIIGSGKYVAEDSKETDGDGNLIKIPSIQCKHKSKEGGLYPLAKSFIFLPSPAMVIKNDSIKKAEFDQFTGDSFVLTFLCEGGKKHQFTGLKHAEHEAIRRWFDDKDIKNGNQEEEQDMDGDSGDDDISDVSE